MESDKFRFYWNGWALVAVAVIAIEFTASISPLPQWLVTASAIAVLYLVVYLVRGAFLLRNYLNEDRYKRKRHN